jgi:hypothetical protein
VRRFVDPYQFAVFLFRHNEPPYVIRYYKHVQKELRMVYIPCEDVTWAFFMNRRSTTMRNGKRMSRPELSDNDAAILESFLLAVLNLGKQRQNVSKALLIEREKALRPEDWTREVQARITALSRLAINISKTLRSLPPITEMKGLILVEWASREQIVSPLNDAFSACSLTPHFRLNFYGNGQDFTMEEVLSGGIANHAEGLAMMGLRDLMKRGEIGNLRECGIPECGAWFVANKRRKKEQKFCGGACRQKNHRSKPESNEQRRKNHITKKFLRTPKRKKVKHNAKASK